LLLAVVRDLGPGTILPRCRFFSAYSARGIESFFGTLARWTQAHGVALTGHELFGHVGGWELYGAFPELDIRTNFGGDHFAIDRARTSTLVDASNFSAQLSPIMGDSVARAHGRARSGSAGSCSMRSVRATAPRTTTSCSPTPASTSRRPATSSRGLATTT